MPDAIKFLRRRLADDKHASPSVKNSVPDDSKIAKNDEGAGGGRKKFRRLIMPSPHPLGPISEVPLSDFP